MIAFVKCSDVVEPLTINTQDHDCGTKAGIVLENLWYWQIQPRRGKTKVYTNGLFAFWGESGDECFESKAIPVPFSRTLYDLYFFDQNMALILAACTSINWPTGTDNAIFSCNTLGKYHHHKTVEDLMFAIHEIWSIYTYNDITSNLKYSPSFQWSSFSNSIKWSRIVLKQILITKG
jgi:hypothetical protein